MGRNCGSFVWFEILMGGGCYHVSRLPLRLVLSKLHRASASAVVVRLWLDVLILVRSWFLPPFRRRGIVNVPGCRLN